MLLKPPMSQSQIIIYLITSAPGYLQLSTASGTPPHHVMYPVVPDTSSPIPFLQLTPPHPYSYNLHSYDNNTQVALAGLRWLACHCGM